MTPREAELLLGGYAAGILTDEERSGLFAAALDNQALFDALADEEALRSLLADPRARAELLRAVTAESGDPAWIVRDEQFDLARARAAMPASQPPAGPQSPEPAPAAGESWWRKIFRPAPMAAFSAVAIAAVGLVVVVRPGRQPEQQTAKVLPATQVDASAPRTGAPAPVAAPAASQKPQAVARAVKSSESGNFSESLAKAKQEPERAVESDRNRIAMRDEERPKIVSQAEPVAAAPPPQPLASAPAAAPPAGVPAAAPVPQVREAVADERKADLARAQATPAEAPAAARSRPAAIGGALSRLGARKEDLASEPFVHWIEHDRARTARTEFKAGDSVRIAVEGRVAGRLEASIGTRRLAATDLRPGRRYFIPTRGSLPNGTGDQDVELVFRPAAGGEFRVMVRVSFR